MSRDRTLGVLGGGQLGRMFVQAAQQMGFATVVFDPEAEVDGVLSPAAQVSQHYIQANYDNFAALKQLADQCFAVTTEFENVSADALAYLSQRCQVSPKADAVRIAQDRRLEKAHFKACGVPTAPFCVIESPSDIAAVPVDFYPAILKTARMGYDGKGQVTIRNSTELHAAWHDLSGVACVLEQRLALAAECSILLARQINQLGEATTIDWPVQHNVHVNGILSTTEVDVVSTHKDLMNAAKGIAAQLNYAGVLCIEFFLLFDGSWVVNEMAPRPHNSGHVTMDASSLSQFEAQVRIAAGLPLVVPRQHSAAVMVNVLGDVWFPSKANQINREPNWASVLALGSKEVGVHLHLYGKAQARLARKMGHINVTGATLDAARTVALQIQKQLGSDSNSSSIPIDIYAAAQVMAAGGLVAFPTETVYGLGADATNDAAVAKIFTAKGRPADHPLIVHLANPSRVADFAVDIPVFAQSLIATFWPGPLTLILPRRPEVALAAAGGQGSIGLRCPSHPMALSLLRECQKLGVLGVAAPSANRFGRVSPTCAEHVRDEFGVSLMLLDGGACDIGIESAIIDCTRGVPVLLRPGVLTIKQLEAACGEAVHLPQDLPTATPKASGTLESHYAPRAKVRLMDTPRDALTHAALYARSHWQASSHQSYRKMPEDAQQAAHEIFAVLRELDASGVLEIWIQTPPNNAAWDGVRDRLTRAAA